MDVSYLAFMVFIYLIQRTELSVGNQSLRLTNFTHFARRSDFPRGKENVDTFSKLV